MSYGRSLTMSDLQIVKEALDICEDLQNGGDIDEADTLQVLLQELLDRMETVHD